MATANPFDLLGDDDNDDPSQLINRIAAPKKALAPAQAQAQASAPASKPAAKLPSKPAPPAQAVREAKNEGSRGGGRGGGRGYGRSRGGGINRDFANSESSFSSSGQVANEESDAGKPSERRAGYSGPRPPFRGGRRGGFSNGEVVDGERPRRVFERRSGTGHGNEFKREGAGRGNWGTQADELAPVTEDVINEGERAVGVEKPSGDEDAADGHKETPPNEVKEPEEMTLEEYQKVLEEKRKGLQLKTEERKVDIDKELASMQQLSNKKSSDDIFVKLGLDKDKRKEIAEKEERAKKSLSINEFLKPAEGEYGHGRGRGRGRGPRGGGAGLYAGNPRSNLEAPKIEDPGEFPTLGAK
ncbi:hypothetical protein RJ640_007347 [Escallonia rubra]|uniref:Hyaluronan/mRNA-binding protein domain-containing protein n=2 Tax=Escallonia rubra TaxID=112253 RepID=A0AA88QY84_9ASTE|nr:hypothetical protein RJ640_007347 [Escallonia rubra]